MNKQNSAAIAKMKSTFVNLDGAIAAIEFGTYVPSNIRNNPSSSPSVDSQIKEAFADCLTNPRIRPLDFLELLEKLSRV